MSDQEIKQLYQHICGLVQSRYLSAGELVTIIKTHSAKVGLKWMKESEKVIKELFPAQGIMENRFF